MSKKKLLICGATGFIGRNLIEYYAAKPEYEVFGTYLDTEPFKCEGVKMIKADLTKPQDVDRVVKGMDIILQAAATTSGAKDIINKPYYHVTDNAVMNSLIFRSAFEHKVSRVLFFSCTVMYQSSETPVKETDFDANKEIHKNYFGVGWTKVYVEKMSEFYSRIGQAKYTVFRHSNIYGPHDKYDLEKSHVFGATVTKVLTANDGKIVVWGEGEAARDLLYVADLIDCVDLALNKQESKFELFNVGYGSAVLVKELVTKIIKHSGRDLKIEYDKTKPNIKTKLCLDIAKVKKALGWSPKTSLDQGIARTLEWYKTNFMAAVQGGKA